MLYRDVRQVSIFGLHGTLYVQRARNADGVSVQTSGPYEVKDAGGSELLIFPEGQEPRNPVQVEMDITAGGTRIGSVDVAADVQFGGPSPARVKARASATAKATVRITAPPGTTFELIGCHGLRKGPGGWRFMQGSTRFTTR